MPVVINKEDILLIIAPLHDVVWYSRNDNPSNPWHGGMIAQADNLSIKIGDCPLFPYFCSDLTCYHINEAAAPLF